MASSFPPELIEKTLDELDDHKDFSTCSRLCRFWLPFAQSRIFRTVTLGSGVGGGYPEGLVELPHLGGPRNDFVSFFKLLSDSDHLADVIVTLNLGLRPQMSSTTQWDMAEEAIALLLPKLTALQHLGLFPCSPLPSPIYIPERLQSSFAGLELQSLHLSQWCLGDPTPLTAIGHILPSTLRFIHCNFNLAFTGGLATLFGLPTPPTPVLPLLPSPLPCLDINRYSSLESQDTIKALFALSHYVTHELVIIFEEVSTQPNVLLNLHPFRHIRHVHLTFEAGGITANETALREWFLNTLFTLELQSGCRLVVTLNGRFFHSTAPDWDGIMADVINSNSSLLLEHRIFNYSLTQRTLQHYLSCPRVEKWLDQQDVGASLVSDRRFLGRVSGAYRKEDEEGKWTKGRREEKTEEGKSNNQNRRRGGKEGQRNREMYQGEEGECEVRGRWVKWLGERASVGLAVFVIVVIVVCLEKKEQRTYTESEG
ncbi:hypothetical protein R3P38DRAFT_2759571 [Favolaschia claudopus]|uniref:F-box domain-containing protein n=1 Tax=Favolaschia claudopus TaxID=2862362 RepID=A0AAW0DWP6_9AGAR